MAYLLLIVCSILVIFFTVTQVVIFTFVCLVIYIKLYQVTMIIRGVYNGQLCVYKYMIYICVAGITSLNVQWISVLSATPGAGMHNNILP